MDYSATLVEAITQWNSTLFVAAKLCINDLVLLWSNWPLHLQLLIYNFPQKVIKLFIGGKLSKRNCTHVGHCHFE